MKLSNLVTQILEQTDGVEDYDHLTENYIYKSLEFRGKRNKYLLNPLNQEKGIRYLRQREIPLTGEEEIDGEYLLFTEMSHDELTFLEDFDSLSELESEIVSDCGIINPFTTYSAGFVNGKVKDYEISFFDNTLEKRVIFVKEVEDRKNQSSEHFADRRIRWTSC